MWTQLKCNRNNGGDRMMGQRSNMGHTGSSMDSYFEFISEDAEDFGEDYFFEKNKERFHIIIYYFPSIYFFSFHIINCYVKYVFTVISVICNGPYDMGDIPNWIHHLLTGKLDREYPVSCPPTR